MKKYGFTLMEIMVVVLIIGMIAVFAIPQCNKMLIMEKIRVAKDQVKLIYNTEQIYQQNKGGTDFICGGGCYACPPGGNYYWPKPVQDCAEMNVFFLSQINSALSLNMMNPGLHYWFWKHGTFVGSGSGYDLQVYLPAPGYENKGDEEAYDRWPDILNSPLVLTLDPGLPLGPNNPRCQGQYCSWYSSLGN